MRECDNNKIHISSNLLLSILSILRINKELSRTADWAPSAGVGVGETLHSAVNLWCV